jgi:VanZ family protein
MLTSRIVSAIMIAVFLVVLAAFAGVLLKHGNTLAMVDPLIRWVKPAVSSDDIERIHKMAREFGHFLIPGAAFAILVIAPLRRRPVLALGLCIVFAVIDESLQSFIPGRTGSLEDVILDTSGAVFAYFVYRVIVSSSRTSEESWS